jgi:hypothetical protein
LRQLHGCFIIAAWLKGKRKDFPWISQYIDSGDTQQLTAKIESVELWPQNGLVTLGQQREDFYEDVKGADDEVEPDLQRGASLREKGKLAESREVLQKVLKERIVSLGKEHFRTQEAMSQLGRTLRALGELPAALQLHEEVLDARRCVLGNDHELTSVSMEILADTLLLAGDVVRARQLQAEAGEAQLRNSGILKAPENREYFEKYMQLFKNGVFYLERNEYDQYSHKKISRAYFSGAIDLRSIPFVVCRDKQLKMDRLRSKSNMSRLSTVVTDTIPDVITPSHLLASSPFV